MSEDPKSDEKAEKAEKALRKLEAERGLLDPEGRYKALINAIKMTQDLIEMGDKKARFALVIMSVLNAVAVLLVVKGGDNVFPTAGLAARLVPIEFGVYVIITVYYVYQAIAALRPRVAPVPAANELPASVVPGESMRVLFYADAAARSKGQYRAIWESMRMDNLTTELADQLHTLSEINRQKYVALGRLYYGLTVMAVTLGILIGTIALNRVAG